MFRSRYFRFVALIVYLTVLILIVEYAVRHIVIAQDFQYFHVSSRKYPHHYLVNEYSSPEVNIRNGRREAVPRGKRDIRIAMVGDSVTFGGGVSDQDAFVEIMQGKQDKIDLLNFGVPGYGIMEIGAVVERVMRDEEIDGVIYVYNFNDLYPSMAGLLSLLSSKEDRLTTIDDYRRLDSTYHQVKKWVKDHFKTAFVIKNIAGGAFLSDRSVGVFVYGEGRCEEDIYEIITKDSSRINYEAWKQMYVEEALMERFRAELVQMRDRVRAKGAFFLIVPHHDYLIMHHQDRALVDNLHRQFDIASLDYVDTFATYAKEFQECEFYSDPGHLGNRGNEMMANILLQAINERVSPE